MSLLKTIHNAVNTVYNWALLSSANPNQASLTVKFLLTAQIPIVMNAILFGCNFHVACIPVTSDQLAVVSQDVANIIFYILTTIGYVGAAIAFVRKVYLTIRGQHASVQ